MNKPWSILVALAVMALLPFTADAQVTLRASHQFPGGKGDPRDEMVQIIAREAKAANVGLDVQVYPGASLFKPNDQWNALVNGQLDISSFPLDYASGKGARLQRHADAGAGAQPRTGPAAEQVAVHERDQSENLNVDVLPLIVDDRARFWLAIVATVVSLVFALVMTVLTFQFWWEAWENNWLSESMWRARLWMPYAAMPIGLGLLTLQYIADFLELVTGRARPFGGEANA